jgi:hypothetical protein
MTRKHPPIGVIAARIKPLSPRHRLAHLRALIRQQAVGPSRRDELAALLREQFMAAPTNDNRAP